ncbi:hypothetical protein [Spirosoma endophyticum]|uniref:Uncharacterized protein n=1 Tax=Spirosoma endophyticum TaxID=662367 RepID=A0A1I1GN89_9BACT|nr:hypothetical protein [Spirosoma endophyticum]SFC12925.1 hypothetical protein SAMN05216167_101516 [Spirosoma endophyticum]
MKLIVKNIANLWFSADTPIRQYKIKLHPEVWAACQKVNRYFKAPSGAVRVEQYRKSDKVAFANAVLDVLEKTDTPAKEDVRVYDFA